MAKRTAFSVMSDPPVRHGRDEYPLWRRMSIETSSRCNRACSFCPVSTGRRNFRQTLMDDDVFDRIASELAQLRWEGVIELYGLNEPLLDKTLPDRITHLRAASPRSTIYVTTNGDVLAASDDPTRAVEQLTTLYVAGLNSINLNVYDEGDDGDERLRFYTEVVARAAHDPILRAKVNPKKYSAASTKRLWMAISDMRPSRQHARERGGTIDKIFAKTTEERKPTTKRYCSRPMKHLYIRYDGKVMLCCAEDTTAPASGVFGDLSYQTMVEVWNGEKFTMYRHFLQDGRRVLPGCDTCEDQPAYSHVVRKVSASQTKVREWEREAKS